MTTHDSDNWRRLFARLPAAEDPYEGDEAPSDPYRYPAAWEDRHALAAIDWLARTCGGVEIRSPAYTKSRQWELGPDDEKVMGAGDTLPAACFAALEATLKAEGKL